MANRSSRMLPAALLVGVMIFIAHLPALHGQFLNWDDDLLITENLTVRSPDGLADIWSSPSISSGHPNYPLTATTHWLEYRLWGANPVGYHLVNLLLHAVNGMLVLTLAVRLGTSLGAAVLAGLLFGMHPAQVESVAWVAERKNLLSGTFALLCMLSFLRFREKPGSRAGLGTILAFAAALLSKTALVTLPVSLLALKRPGQPAPSRPVIGLLVALSALSALAAVITLGTERPPVDPLALASRPLLVARTLGFYAATLVIPADLCPVYPRWPVSGADPLAWLSLAAIGIAAALLFLRRIDARLRWGAVHFVALLAPASGLVAYGYQTYTWVADRHLYLAALGPFLILAVLFDRVRRHSPRVAPAAAVALLAFLALLTRQQIPLWQSSETLWTETLTCNPGSPVAETNLASLRILEDRPAEAIRLLKEALAEWPDFPHAHANLAVALYQQGRAGEAVAHGRHALRFHPEKAEWWKNLGIILDATGDRAAAQRAFRAALERRADSEYAFLLVRSLVNTGELHDAARMAARAAERFPRSQRLHTQLGRIQLALDRPRHAAAAFQRATRLDPQCAPCWANLALALQADGRLERARQAIERALEAQPDYPPARELRRELGGAME